MNTPAPDHGRRLLAEGVGTALLLACVAGSGIMAERLAGGNVAVALLANAMATAAALFALITVFAPISGAHFNPAVSLVAAFAEKHSVRETASRLMAQFAGAFTGVALANLMFDEPLFSLSRHERSGWSQALGEFVATFGLLTVIRGSAKNTVVTTAGVVAAYIAAAYWFTSSTSFANPAVTLARAFTDTFSGIRIEDVPAFWAAQIAGATAGFLFSERVFREAPARV